MARRIAVLLALLAALLIAGCGYGTPATLTADQEQARIAFIESHADFSDVDLAQLCPALYPRDFLTDHDRWPAGKRTRTDMSARAIEAAAVKDAAAVRAAGCDVFPE